jgi:hypothetical protein
MLALYLEALGEARRSGAVPRREAAQMSESDEAAEDAAELRAAAVALERTLAVCEGREFDLTSHSPRGYCVLVEAAAQGARTAQVSLRNPADALDRLTASP